MFQSENLNTLVTTLGDVDKEVSRLAKVQLSSNLC
jgi:hypothetical protein